MGFGSRRKIVVVAAIAALCSARARGTDTAPPVSCNAEELERPLQGYQQLKDEACNSLANDDCAQTTDIRPGHEGHKISICNLANQLMQEAAKRYHEDIHNYCPQLKSEFQTCKAGDAKSITPCTLSAASKMGEREQSIAAAMTDYKAKIAAMDLQKKIDKLLEKYRKDKDLLKRPDGTWNRDPGVVTQCGNSNHSPYPRQYYIQNLETDDRQDSVFRELKDLGERSKSFLQAAEKTQTYHQGNVTKFNNQVTQLSDITSRMGAEDPAAVNDKSGGNKSDVTGGGKGSGGGGSGGGGGGGGSGSGSSGGTPSSLASAAGSQGDASGRSPASMGDSSSASQAGANQSAPQPSPSYSVGMNSNASKADPSVQATASAWPRTAGAGAKSMTADSSPGYGTGASSARPSSATASGGGGTGGAGSDGPVAAAEKRCAGKECAGAGGAPAQFAAVGSLGALGGLEALAPLDGGGSLDSFLKDDKGKAFGGAGLDNGLANLDASTADLLAGAGDGSGRSSEIGAANDEDLFVRLHQFHQRAQKRGMVVRLTRKL